MEFINADRLKDDVKRKTLPYCNEILEKIPGVIRSIVLYGSAISEEYEPGRSDINLLLVCERLDLGVFKYLEEIVKRGIKRKIVPPLIFTPEHIERSKDVFPIEFLEMKDSHITIYGEEIFEKLDIDNEHLRLECEEQIKGKLIRTRQAWFEVAGDRNKLINLLYTSLVNVIPSVRGLLRLKGKIPPSTRREVIIMVDDILDIDLKVFNDVLDAKKGEKVRDLNLLFVRYLEALSSLADYVDRM